MNEANQGAASSASRSPGHEQPEGESLTDLVRQLTHQGSHLAEQQLNLIRAELRETVGQAQAAAGAIGGAAVIGIAGLGVTLMGLAYLLGDAIDNLGLATLIVGVVTLIIALVLYNIGSKKIRDTKIAPDRTIRTLERTPDAARGNLTQE